MDCVTYNAFGALAFAYESHDTFVFPEVGWGRACWGDMLVKSEADEGAGKCLFRSQFAGENVGFY